jgi:hypothetical protein
MRSPTRNQPQFARWNLLAPLSFGVFLSVLALFWTPWQRIHPNDASLRESIGWAPFWSHRFDDVVGARIDWMAFLTNLAIIWILCYAAAFMLRDKTPTE